MQGPYGIRGPKGHRGITGEPVCPIIVVHEGMIYIIYHAHLQGAPGKPGPPGPVTYIPAPQVSYQKKVQYYFAHLY